jgi:uncharacterized membrane protein YbhN (UPF0104 family)
METNSDSINNIETGEIRKRIISVTIRIVVSAIVLYFVFSLVKWQDVLSAYHSANASFILFGGLLLIANLGIRTIKWHIMLLSVKKAPTLKEAFGSVMLGISLGSFTPGEVGEFAGRALHISNAKNLI